MIPEKLMIKGIYSYMEPAEIHFDSLIETGLFGIFGLVGSGKSTILEAITYVLYGETERLNNRDAKLYNMMNLRSDEMEIDFVFRQHTNRYRFVASAKRNSKQFDSISRSDRKAYKWEHNGWIPLESANAAHVIGLKYDHFKQIVIIPQGKFNEFIQLSSQQRTDMLKELFPQMERFDFKRPLQMMLGEVKGEISTIEGQLQELEEYKPEMVDGIKNEIEQKRSNLTRIANQLEQSIISLNKLNEVKKLVNELEQIEKKYSILIKNKEKFEHKENNLKQYESYLTHYQPLFQRIFELKDLHTQLEERRKEMQAKNSKIENLLKQNEKDFEEIINQGGDIDAHKNGVAALEKAIQVVAMQDELTKNRQLLSVDSTACAQEEEERARLQREIDLEKENLRKLRSKLLDEDALHSLLNNYKEEKRIREQLTQIQIDLDENSKLVEKLAENKLEILKNIDSDRLSVDVSEMKTNKLVETLKNSISNLKIELKQLRIRETFLIEQGGIARYANKLLDTEPCPLCGSLQHPNPFTGDVYKKELEKARNRILHIESVIEKNNTAVISLNMLIERFKTEQKRRNQRANELVNINRALKKNIVERDLIPLKYSQKELLKVLGQQKDVKQQIQLSENSIDKKDRLLRNTSKLDKLNNSLQKIKTQIATLEATISVQINQIENQWLSKTCEELTRMKNEVLNNINRLNELKIQMDDYNLEIHIISAVVETLNNQQLTIKNQINLKNKELNERLSKDKIDNSEEVKLVLETKLNVEKERLEIVNYQRELYATNQRLKDLQVQLGSQTYDVDEIVIMEKHIAETKQLKSEIEKAVGALDKTLQILQEKLIVKQLHLTHLKKNIKRKENLDVLSTLFRGDGFIQFVSQIYLEQLCSLANQRFKVLTNNRLEIEIGEKQQFVVRDFLNDGHTRLLKTLSGGQTFQAAFSLAMALSEQIQKHQHVNQQFFFMDEGFGSLDKESLSVVFDTLKLLRHENITVGIISHVEELQTEIDRFIHVKNNNDKGSSISMIV